MSFSQFKPLAVDEPASPSICSSSTRSLHAADTRSPRPVSTSSSSFDLFSEQAAISLQPTHHDVERSQANLGLWASIAVISGSMIGSGIFISAGPVFAYTESVTGSISVWLIAGCISICGGLCYAELGTIIQGNGGEYAYLLEAYGRFSALTFLWTSFTLLKSGSAAILAITCAQYTSRLIFKDDAHAHNVLIQRTISILYLLLAGLINTFSKHTATRAQSYFFWFKMCAVLLICMAGGYAFVLRTGVGPVLVPYNPNTSHDSTLASHHSWLLALQASLWGFDGWNNLNYVTEKVKSPEKTLPRAIVISISMVTLCYVLTNFAYLTVLPPKILTNDRGMVTEFGQLAFGSIGTVILPLCIVISTFGALASTVFVASHLVTAAASQSHLPTMFAVFDANRNTPVNAVVLQVSLAVPIVISTQLVSLLHWYSFASYIFYGLTAFSVLVLRFLSPKWKFADRPFSVPLVAPVVFVLVCVWMLGVAVMNEPVRCAVLGVWMTLGFVVWAIRQGVESFRTRGNLSGILSSNAGGYARTVANEEHELLEE